MYKDAQRWSLTFSVLRTAHNAAGALQETGEKRLSFLPLLGLEINSYNTLDLMYKDAQRWSLTFSVLRTAHNAAGALQETGEKRLSFLPLLGLEINSYNTLDLMYKDAQRWSLTFSVLRTAHNAAGALQETGEKRVKFSTLARARN